MRTTTLTLLCWLLLSAAACGDDDHKSNLVGGQARGGDAGRDLAAFDAGWSDADAGWSDADAAIDDTGSQVTVDVGLSDSTPDPGGTPDAGPGVGDSPDDDPIPPDDPNPPDDPLDPGLPGFIGSACETAADCEIDDALCLTETDGYPLGMCVQPCTRLCPDRGGYPTTFCTEAESAGAVCHSRCDYVAYPGVGCRDGYACAERARAGEPATVVGTCVPDDGTTVLSPCLQWLVDHDVPFEPTTYASRSPSGRPDLTCDVEDPIRLHSPVNGINLRYYYDDPGYFRPLLMSCHLAKAIYDTTEILADWDITEIVHVGTTVCRTMSSGSLSQHALGLAIDYSGFFDDQANWYGVEDHWEHDTEAPTSSEALMLWDFVNELFDRWVYNVILTPNYNSAHDSHFHVDLTEGSHFLRVFGPEWGPYLGVNPDGE